MQEYSKQAEIRWADIDPNFHVLHSKYYDYAAFCRLSYMTENGVTAPFMLENNIGLILFREECVFKKEIKFGDSLRINLRLDTCKEDASRWSLINELWINNDTLAAVIRADGAWMDTRLRKIITPPSLCRDAFFKIPR
jgi:acyl-CoA thioester hydrolase